MFNFKFKSGNIEFEISGEYHEVKETLDYLLNNNIIVKNGSISNPSVNSVVSSKISIPLENGETSNENPVREMISDENIPPKIQLVKSGRKLMEKVWILISAYYLNLNSISITIDSLRTDYLKDRDFKSNKNNFQKNLQSLIGVYLVYINKDELVLNDLGKQETREIVLGKSDSFKKIDNKTIPNGRKQPTSKSSKFNRIELPTDFNSEKFIDRFDLIKQKSPKDNIMLILQLYSEFTNIKDFDFDLINTLLITVGIPTPPNLKSMVSNYINRDMILDKTEEGFKFSPRGKKKYAEMALSSDSE